MMIDGNITFEWIWGLLGAPIGYLYVRAINHSSRISKNETEIKNTAENINKLCKTVEKLRSDFYTHSMDVSRTMGRVEQSLNRSNDNDNNSK